jgi:DNA repair exonuclease SbcCD ATPase subunit
MRASVGLPGYPAAMATLEELERRVEQLEEQLRRELPNKVDAVAYGLSLVHADTQAIREALARQGETLTEHGAALTQQIETLAEHGTLLQEILRRLPPAPGEPG